MQSTANRSNQSAYTLLIVGLVFSASLGFGLATTPDDFELVFGRATALGGIATGLTQLFLLAAFEPKTDRQKLTRVGSAAAMTGLVLVGVSFLLADLRLRVAVSCLALTILFVARRS